ncbi:MAG: tetratricopeptide repeat protein [Candidatus Aminicenantes bacterium]|nr:tetratricopeptide repeat protein [Candidatus Aminicenantes bacterium]
MLQKDKKIFLLIFMTVALVFASTSCSKLKISNLRANHHFSNANQYFTDGNYRRAIEEYEQALELNPELIQAYRFLGESYKKMYKPGDDSESNMARAEKALEALKKAYEADPTNRDIIYSLGDMYDLMSNFEEAEKLYLRILELEPTNMNNYYVVAGLYKRYAGEKEELKKKAESMYLRRIEQDPENPQGYAYMAKYYEEMRPVSDFDNAAKYYKFLIELEPEKGIHQYGVGTTYFWKAFRLQNQLSKEERMKLADQSEQYLKKAVEMDPSYSFSYSYLNILYRNVFANLYPDRYDRYIAEADRWQEKFNEVRKRELERIRLEEELRRGEGESTGGEGGN